MTHLKAIASPKALKVHRKEKAWLLKAAPGPHPADAAVSMGVVLRDYLGLVQNLREVRYLLQNNEVTVDGKRVKDVKFALGLLDVFCVGEKCYLMMVDNNARLYPKEVDKAKASENLCKLTGKTMLKGGKLQLNFYDGKNIIIDVKDSKKYETGGTAVINIESGKITSFMPLEVGKAALISKGRHAGKIGKIVEITKSGLNLKSLTTVDTGEEKLLTNTAYIFIVGDKESKI
jgi:small subunit ribosomal protein S4e